VFRVETSWTPTAARSARSATFTSNDRTGEPQWVTVSAGLLAPRSRLSRSPRPPWRVTTCASPSTRTRSRTSRLGIEAQIEAQIEAITRDCGRRGAPRVDADHHLDVEQERELYRYHDLDYAAVTGSAPTSRHRPRRDDRVRGAAHGRDGEAAAPSNPGRAWLRKHARRASLAGPTYWRSAVLQRRDQVVSRHVWLRWDPGSCGSITQLGPAEVL